MNGTGREEHESRHTGLEGGLEELQRAREIDPEEDAGRTVTAAASIAGAFPLDGRVDHRVRTLDQLPRGCLFPQRARQPLDGAGLLLQAAAVTARPVPAAEVMPRAHEVTHEVAAEEAGCTRDGDAHAGLRRVDRNPGSVRNGLG